MKTCEYCAQPMPPWKHRFCNRKCSSYYTRNQRLEGEDGLRYSDIIKREKERKALEIKYGFVVTDTWFDIHVAPPRIRRESNFIYNQRMSEVTGDPKRYIDGEITLNELLELHK